LPVIKSRDWRAHIMEEDARKGVAAAGIFQSAAFAKKAAKAIKKVAGEGHQMRVVTRHGCVTRYGIHRIKVDAKARPGLASDFVAASKGKPFTPIGGEIDLDKKNQAQIAAETLAAMRRPREKTDVERIKEDSDVLIIDDPRGLPVELKPWSSISLRVRMGDQKDTFVGRHTRLARSLVIGMVAITGNPDLFITTAEKLDELGVPRKEKHVWHSNESISIMPTDPDRSSVYYVVVTSGVEKCKFNIVVATDRYIPTISSAIQGKYRPTPSQRAADIGKTFIHPALLEADLRRKNSRAGSFPLAGLPLPHSVYAKRGDDPNMRPMSAMQVREATASTVPPESPVSRICRTTPFAEFTDGHVLVSPQLSTSSERAAPDSLPKLVCSRSVSVAANPSLDTSSIPLAQGEDPSSALSPHSMDDRPAMMMIRPRSALERCIDITFKCTLGRVEADYDLLEMKHVRLKNMRGMLKPKKATSGYVGQQKKQLTLLFGDSTRDLYALKAESFEEDSQHSIGSARASPTPKPDTATREQESGQTGEGGPKVVRKDTGEETVIQSWDALTVETGDTKERPEDIKPAPKFKRRRNAPALKQRIPWTAFRGDLMALLEQAAPVSRKLAGNVYQELLTPVATVAGYAVFHSDVPGLRQLVTASVASSESASQLLPGQTMLVQAGRELPFGADAVVHSKFVLSVTQFQVSERVNVMVKDVPIKGQNLKVEPRPYYVGGDVTAESSLRPGGFMAARDYMRVRYPHLLAKYDEMFAKQFLPPLPKRERFAVEMDQDMLATILKTIETCPSRLMQTLKVAERRALASHCRIDVFVKGALLANEADSEHLHGRSARNMYILVSGDLAIYKFEHTGTHPQVVAQSYGMSSSFASAHEHASAPALGSRSVSCASVASHSSNVSEDVLSIVAPEAHTIETATFGKRIGTVGHAGSLLGERQLLFGEPWPVTVRGLRFASCCAVVPADIHVYACMHTYLYAYAYMYLYIYAYLYVCVCVYTYMYIYMYSCMYICTYLYVCV